MLNRKLPFRIIIVSSILLKVALLFLFLSVLPRPTHLPLTLLVAVAVIAQLRILWRNFRH